MNIEKIEKQLEEGVEWYAKGKIKHAFYSLIVSTNPVLGGLFVVCDFLSDSLMVMEKSKKKLEQIGIVF